MGTCWEEGGGSKNPGGQVKETGDYYEWTPAGGGGGGSKNPGGWVKETRHPITGGGEDEINRATFDWSGGGAQFDGYNKLNCQKQLKTYHQHNNSDQLAKNVGAYHFHNLSIFL